MPPTLKLEVQSAAPALQPEIEGQQPRPRVVMMCAPPVQTALDRILHWFWMRQS